MAHRRAFPRGSGAIARARSTTWLEIEPLQFSIGANLILITHLMTAAELAKRPFTIVRTHLEVQVTSDQIGATERGVLGVGMAVVSDQAVAVGAAAVPAPIDDLDSDLFFLIKLLFYEFTFVTAAGFDSVSGTQASIDSKAMRKVNNDQEAVVVAQTGTVGARFQIGGRILIKEH